MRHTLNPLQDFLDTFITIWAKIFFFPKFIQIKVEFRNTGSEYTSGPVMMKELTMDCYLSKKFLWPK